MQQPIQSRNFLLFAIMSLASWSNMLAQYDPKTIDESEIITTYANYKVGFERFNAAGVMKTLTQPSIAYFDTLLQQALYADSTTLMSLPVSEMIYVLDLRKKARTKVADAKDGTALLDIMLNYGILREDQELQVSSIHMKDSIAYVAALAPSSSKPRDYTFVKVDGYWKIDLLDQFKEADRNFSSLLNDEETLKKYNLSKASLYQSILDKFGIPKGSSEVWLPINKKQ